MSSIETQYSEVNTVGGHSAINSRNITLVLFTATLFTSALLLFSVQPLFTKMVLPKLGGSPSVWSVAMVFFQGVLLAGYGYAHILTRYTKPKFALLIHLVVLSMAFIAMPIAIASNWGNPPQSGQAIWLIGLFLVSVGLPFFAVSANGPLLQAWFSRTNHPHAADPYFLYGASNIGSFAALLSYPVIFEPTFTLGTQAWMWSVGFAALAALIIGCGLIAVRSGVTKAAVATVTGLIDSSPSTRQRATWVGLAFIPSALLVAVTQHISTDIAAAPFLWVVPLALFLLTFVITFQRKPILKHSTMSFALPLLVGPLVVTLFVNLSGLTAVIIEALLHFIVFFVAAMVCHGELVRRRPSATHLTEFYLWMSFGGVLGGIFTSLIAPVIFSTVVEYPLLIVAAFLCRSEFYKDIGKTKRQDILLVLIAAALLIMPSQYGFSFSSDTATLYYIALIMIAGIVMLSREKPVIHFTILASMIIVASFYDYTLKSVEFYRSFFGVNKVAESLDGQFRLLFHGTTLHGAERIRNADNSDYHGKPVPTTYYYADSPLVQAVTTSRKVHGGAIKVAAVGLGSGSLACASRPADTWKFFEIDPVVADIAKDPSKFRFLSECGRKMPIVIGDARLSLQDEKDGFYDLIILDAFSSDAIPVHLLTKDAIKLYLDKLSANGAVVFHISNRHMKLNDVIASIGATHDLVTYSLLKVVDKEKGRTNYDKSSLVAILARDKADLGAIASAGVWKEVPVNRNITPWSDDYSDIIGSIYRHYSNNEVSIE